jgi:hypothetical protein
VKERGGGWVGRRKEGPKRRDMRGGGGGPWPLHGWGTLRGKGLSALRSRNVTVRCYVVSYWGGMGLADPWRVHCYIDSDNRLSNAGKDEVRAALPRVSSLYL